MNDPSLDIIKSEINALATLGICQHITMQSTTKKENVNTAESPATSEHVKSTTSLEEAPTENSLQTKKTSSYFAGGATTKPQTACPSSENSNEDMDIESIAKQIETGDLSPKQVADFESLLSGWYARKRVQYGQLEALSVRYFVENRSSHKTVAEVERAWQATDYGQSEIRLKRECEAIDRLIGAVRTQWFLGQGEAKNTY